MADYAPVAPTEAGAVSTLRTGTASADTVPAGCVLLVINGGAGSHNFDLTLPAGTWHGLQAATSAAAWGKRRFVIANATAQLIRVPADYGDTNGRVAVTIDGTAAEITYHVIGL